MKALTGLIPKPVKAVLGGLLYANVKRPDFIILGGHKCATTSLHFYLAQHPQIWMPDNKGYPHIALRAIWKYWRMFAGAPKGKVIGESSSIYLHKPQAARLIKKHMPSAKLIAMLRDPSERAYSHYVYSIRRTKEPEDASRIIDDPRFIKPGLYFQHLKTYFDLFAREQVKIYFYDDFKKDNAKVMQSIFEFLGVDKNFMPDCSIRYHDITAYRKPAGLPPEIRRMLIEKHFREDILRLQDLLKADLSHWLV